MVPGSKSVSKRRCDMCKGRFGLVRHRFGWKQFCCKACLDKYLSDTTREAQRSKHWLEYHIALNDCENIFRAQEVNRRMKDKAAHACHALCRARVLEEIRRRKGTVSAEHL